MERTAIPAVARGDALGAAAGGVRGLRRGLEPLAFVDAIARRWTEAGAWFAALAAASLFARFSLERHRAFETNAYDFAFFDQIVWNTSHGRFFDTSFLTYNFLGQHFEPVLLVFALAYRLGAGAESLLVAQALLAGAAAVPLYYAARRATASGVCALALALAYTLSAPLHSALDYDFHPEVMGFFFVFLALYFLISARPIATMLALLPLLALKEDMALVLLAFALLLALRGHRREGAVLGTVAVAYIAAVVVIAMPLIRGGSGDLSVRYAYLFDGANAWTLAPHAAWRAASQLAHALPAVAGVESSLGFAALLSPAGVAAAAPTLLLATLSDHPQQSSLELQYAVPSLALSWVAAVLALAWVAARGEGGAASRRWRRAATFVLAALVLASAAFTFARSSPYSPTAGRYAPPAAHRQAVRDALALVPPAAPVSAQGTLLPHLSHREQAYEFPEVHGASYIVVDAALPVTAQARAAGYDAAVAALPGGHYEQIFARDGVRVFRLLP